MAQRDFWTGLLLTIAGTASLIAPGTKINSIADKVRAQNEIRLLATPDGTYRVKISQPFLIHPNPDNPNAAVDVRVALYQSEGVEYLLFLHDTTKTMGKPFVMALIETRQANSGAYDGRLDFAVINKPISEKQGYRTNPNEPILKNIHGISVDGIYEQLPK